MPRRAGAARRADGLATVRRARARLAEGRPAVEHTQTYVQACHVLGYQHPDLTAHGSQVLDWYETESGLDLRVLDDDSAELRARAQHDRRGDVAATCAAHRDRGGLDGFGGRLRDAVSAAALRHRGGGGRPCPRGGRGLCGAARQAVAAGRRQGRDGRRHRRSQAGGAISLAGRRTHRDGRGGRPIGGRRAGPPTSYSLR